jgi:hypothetical protein
MDFAKKFDGVRLCAFNRAPVPRAAHPSSAPNIRLKAIGRTAKDRRGDRDGRLWRTVVRT